MRYLPCIGPAILLACSTSSNPEPTASSRLLAVYDLDGNTTLDESEFRRVANPDLPFHEVDLDGNQAIDSDELHELLIRESPLLPDHRDGN